MNNPWFYRSTIKNLVIAVSNVFNNIEVHRTDDTNTVVKTIKIPFKFGPTDKIHQYRTEAEATQKYYMSTPSMALVLESISYDDTRAASTGEVRCFYDPIIGLNDMDAFWSDVNPVPYNFHFKLSIKTDLMDDWCQIVENILPIFKPAMYIRIKEFSFLNIERDIQLLISNTNLDFLLEQGSEDRRYTNGTIEFVAKAYMYKPITDTGLIKKIQTKFNLIEETSQSVNNVLESTYTTSGFTNTSAYPPTSAFGTSGTLYYET